MSYPSSINFRRFAEDGFTPISYNLARSFGDLKATRNNLSAFKYISFTAGNESIKTEHFQNFDRCGDPRTCTYFVRSAGNYCLMLMRDVDDPDLDSIEFEEKQSTLYDRYGAKTYEESGAKGSNEPGRSVELTFINPQSSGIAWRSSATLLTKLIFCDENYVPPSWMYSGKISDRQKKRLTKDQRAKVDMLEKEITIQVKLPNDSVWSLRGHPMRYYTHYTFESGIPFSETGGVEFISTQNCPSLMLQDDHQNDLGDEWSRNALRTFIRLEWLPGFMPLDVTFMAKYPRRNLTITEGSLVLEKVDSDAKTEIGLLTFHPDADSLTSIPEQEVIPLKEAIVVKLQNSLLEADTAVIVHDSFTRHDLRRDKLTIRNGYPLMGAQVRLLTQYEPDDAEKNSDEIICPDQPGEISTIIGMLRIVEMREEKKAESPVKTPPPSIHRLEEERSKKEDEMSTRLLPEFWEKGPVRFMLEGRRGDERFAYRFEGTIAPEFRVGRSTMELDPSPVPESPEVVDADEKLGDAQAPELSGFSVDFMAQVANRISDSSKSQYSQSLSETLVDDEEDYIEPGRENIFIYAPIDESWGDFDKMLHGKAYNLSETYKG